ncbi:MAG: selenocysteine-specific translation elongation factor [Gemmatimonadales bacterium]
MIIGTAGHIDHGKSALVTALTGRSVDRLAEERKRGITIELNFAPLALDGLPPIGIVDVPGHEDFVRTMVAGATGIDLVLLVVDLSEGPRPQTDEHLAIVEQLRIPRGIPVLTKADLVEPDWAELVAAEVRERTARSPVAFGEPVVVSAQSGLGIERLRERIREEAERRSQRAVDDRLRLPVDRVFSLAGVGTVVTGTVWTGSVAVGDTVRLLPGGRTARIRSVECYGSSEARALPGTRAALGLVGADREDAARGTTVVGADAPWQVTDVLDGEIELLPSAPRPLVPRDRVRVHLGTAELIARAYPRGAIAPGSRGPVRLALEHPAIARGEDRFVVRSYSPVATIGGGWIADPAPPPRARWPDQLTAPDRAERLVALATRRRDGIPDADLDLLLGPLPDEARAEAVESGALVARGGRLVSRAVVERIAERLLDAVARHHEAQRHESGLSLETARRAAGGSPAVVEATLSALADQGRLELRGDVVALPGFAAEVEGGDRAVAELVAALVEAGLEPPELGELAERLGVRSALPLAKRAVEAGRLVAIARDRFFAAGAVGGFVDALKEIGREGPITPAAIRDRLGTSRKFTIPLLEWADREGITRREGDARVLVERRV